MRKFAKTIIIMLTLTMLFGVGAMAEKKSISFSVAAGGYGYTAGNKKSDDEQKAYVTITNKPIKSTDVVYFNVKKGVSQTATSVTGNIRMSPESIVNTTTMTYHYSSPKKDTVLYLEIYSKNRAITFEGQWNS